MEADAAVALAVMIRATIMLPLVLLAVWANLHLSMVRRRAESTATSIAVTQASVSGNEG
jgi:hypothetical protein